MTPPSRTKQRHSLQHTGLGAQPSSVRVQWGFSHEPGSRMWQGTKLAKAHTTTEHGNLDPFARLFVCPQQHLAASGS